MNNKEKLLHIALVLVSYTPEIEMRFVFLLKIFKPVFKRLELQTTEIIQMQELWRFCQDAKGRRDNGARVRSTHACPALWLCNLLRAGVFDDLCKSKDKIRANIMFSIRIHWKIRPMSWAKH